MKATISILGSYAYQWKRGGANLNTLVESEKITVEGNQLRPRLLA